jgi:hypothetical protein
MAADEGLPWDDPEVAAADLREAIGGIEASGGPRVFGAVGLYQCLCCFGPSGGPGSCQACLDAGPRHTHP